MRSSRMCSSASFAYSSTPLQSRPEISASRKRSYASYVSARCLCSAASSCSSAVVIDSILAGPPPVYAWPSSQAGGQGCQDEQGEPDGERGTDSDRELRDVRHGG